MQGLKEILEHDDYCERIWSDQEIRLARTALEWQKNLDEEGLDERAEKLIISHTRINI